MRSRPNRQLLGDEGLAMLCSGWTLELEGATPHFDGAVTNWLRRRLFGIDTASPVARQSRLDLPETSVPAHHHLDEHDRERHTTQLQALSDI